MKPTLTFCLDCMSEVEPVEVDGDWHCSTHGDHVVTFTEAELHDWMARVHPQEST